MSTFICSNTWGFVRSLLSKSPACINAVQSRQRKRWERAYLKALYQRRLEVGPEPDRRRSDFSNWNHDAEIFAFSKRLGEEFNESTLKAAFTDRSYRIEQEAKLKELGVSDISSVDSTDNIELAEKGESLINDFIQTYLRHAYPLMFEEGIQAIHNYLTSEDMLAHIGSHLGIKDLIFCELMTLHWNEVIELVPMKGHKLCLERKNEKLSKFEYHTGRFGEFVDKGLTDSKDQSHQSHELREIVPMKSTLCQTFKAIVGALATDKGKERAQLFVRDFVLPQLIGKDINELYNIVNPMGALTSMLKLQNREPPEPRLLWQSGSETIMSVYYVGIYSNKELIGKSPGETVTIAEEMAARDALKNIMKTQDYRPPFQYKSLPQNMNFNRVNWSLQELSVKELSDGS